MKIYVVVTKMPTIRKTFRFSTQQSLNDILQIISNEFQITVKKLYSEERQVILNTNEIMNGSTLYVSEDGNPLNELPVISMTVLLVGDTVGKTSLIVRYLLKIYPDVLINQNNFNKKVYKQLITIKRKLVDFTIIDTNSIQEFNLELFSSCEEYKGVLGVYSIDSEKSFELIERIISKVITLPYMKSMPIILVGNKMDEEQKRKVHTTKAEEYAKSVNAEFYETSAKTDVNVQLVFERVIERLYELTCEPKHLKTSLCFII